MTEIYNFNYLLGHLIPNGDINLLLGNGFSIGLDVRFQAKSIQDTLCAHNQYLKVFFEKFETSNIEKIMESIETTKNVLSILGKSEAFNHEKYINEIKDAFLRAIADIHPQKLIDDNKVDKIKSIFMGVDKIFTTNYDLMLYWIVMDLLRTDGKSFNDGFDKQTGILLWQKKFEQNLFYLHGALQMHSLDNGELLKNSYVPPFDTIIKQLRINLDQSKWPMIVLEGTSEQKVKAIESSRYLQNTFSKFREIKHAIFIHGFSFNKKDAHIYNAIFENEDLEHICIGIDQANSDTFTRIIHNISRNTTGENKTFFYNRDTIWS